MPRRSPRPAACRYAAALAALAAALVTVAAAPAATRPRVPVYFLQGEQLAHVNRPGASAADAVRQLLAGPTRAEVARGFRTYVPARSRLRSVTVADGLATVDLDTRFASG